MSLLVEPALYYFAYGSNMLTSRLEERVGKVALHGVGVLKDYVFKFNKISQDGGKANIEPCSGSEVSGVLFKVTAEQLAILDVFEGAPHHYQRVIVKVGEIKAIAYIATPKYTAKTSLTPSTEYLNLILNGAKEHRIKMPAELPGDISSQ